jgi:hypothetical protein
VGEGRQAHVHSHPGRPPAVPGDGGSRAAGGHPAAALGVVPARARHAAAAGPAIVPGQASEACRTRTARRSASSTRPRPSDVGTGPQASGGSGGCPRASRGSRGIVPRASTEGGRPRRLSAAAGRQFAGRIAIAIRPARRRRGRSGRPRASGRQARPGHSHGTGGRHRAQGPVTGGEPPAHAGGRIRACEEGT